VVLDNLRLVGWGIALIVLQELVAYAFNWPSVWQRRDQLGHPDGDPGRVRLLHDKSSAVDRSRNRRIGENRNREGMSSPAFFRATNGFPKLVGLLLPFLWPRLPSTSSKKLSLLIKRR
jgi:hypothetical protein